MPARKSTCPPKPLICVSDCTNRLPATSAPSTSHSPPPHLPRISSPTSNSPPRANIRRHELVECKRAIGPIGHFDWDGPQRRQFVVQWTIRLVRVREPHRRGKNGCLRIIGIQFSGIFDRQEQHHVA